MRSKAARLIGTCAALALVLGLGAIVEARAGAGAASHQVLADEASPHSPQP
ncbi:hypothetical protein [Streptomyces sp. UG1]|uniref:hypothetical protein n=1 Tax=Streptomyces sp. UG1 TaxID=3417652 RepID=UPI003CF6BAAA